LSSSPVDPARREAEALLAPLWPEVVQRLGDRVHTFHERAWAASSQHGLSDTASAARYLNLCFAFGPAFEERPENEWALAILADDRLSPWLKLHQLVLRSGRELRRRGEDAKELLLADASLLDALDRQRLTEGAQPLARTACDLHVLDLRVLDDGWRHEYRNVDGSWQRCPGPALPPSLRIDADHPAPWRVVVLTHAQGQGPLAQLQLRQILHAGCGERHPAVRWLDATGLSTWQGHEAKAVSWPVHALAGPTVANGMGVSLCEETTPAVHLLEVENCGLRDEGAALGPQRLQVHAYPADQWIFALQRTRAEEPGGPPPRTRLRIERDGTPQSSSAWLDGFDQLLPGAIDACIGRLSQTWQRAAQDGTVNASFDLLVGSAALTWGWREGPGGLDDAPVLRVMAELQLDNIVDFNMEGVVDCGGSRAAVRISTEGNSPLTFATERGRAQPSVLEALLPAVARFRFPLQLQFDPIASDDGTMWSEAGPCTGALIGEAGLRPSLLGGGGWQWYARLSLEPVLAPVTVHDPLLGRTRRTLALLPAMQLLDWGLG
jgi:hypothetical protein